MTTVDYNQYLKETDNELACTVSFMNQTRDFLRDRAELEREYSRKLDSLSKKHIIKQKEKQALAKSFSSGFLNAFDTLLADAKENSDLHAQFADSLAQHYAEQLKTMHIRSEAGRKKLVAYTLHVFRDHAQIIGNVEVSRLSYSQQCDAVNHAKQKYERTTDERHKEKLRQAWHQEILDMNNQKNNYILEVHAANRMQAHFAEVQESLTTACFQEFVAAVQESIMDIWQSATKTLENMNNAISGNAKSSLEIYRSVDLTLPAESFAIAKVVSNHLEFQPCGLWKDAPEIVTDEFSTVYLHNCLKRLYLEQEEYDRKKAVSAKALKDYECLFKAYSINPYQGDINDVRDNIATTKQDMSSDAMILVKIVAKIEQIVKTVGDIPDGSPAHDFKSASFPIPTSCNFCHQTIWGMTKIGFCCQCCGYNCHAKCEMKVAPECSKRAARKRNSWSGQHLAIDSLSRRNIATRASTTRLSDRVPHLETISSTATLLPGEQALEKKRLPVMTPPKPIRQPDAEALFDYIATHDEEVSITEGDKLVASQDSKKLLI